MNLNLKILLISYDFHLYCERKLILNEDWQIRVREKKMEVDEKKDNDLEAYVLNKWQRCHFKLNAAEAQPTPRERADAVRGILSQLNAASLCDK